MLTMVGKALLTSPHIGGEDVERLVGLLVRDK
jgi:hypothetical protein